ncbi:autophagy- protein 2 [Orbilia ellipsospora]|uniref:Autophagy-related protein 2 n=1 Tax=Orbilia ellipsospora TaxID=2528407 RepID=A0AAV9XBV2_9PEZI
MAPRRSRSVKAGMRALRLDGIGISLLGLSDFFDDPVSMVLDSLGDTDTTASNSTVLPPAHSPAGPSNLKSSHPTTSGMAPHPSTDIPITGPSFHDSNKSFNAGSGTSHTFFAQMQEPPHHGYIPPPSPSISPPSSRNSSFRGSIGSDMMNSDLLSRSFLHPESLHGISPSASQPALSDYQPQTHDSPPILEHPNFRTMAEPIGNLIDDDSDDDSFKDEPRDLDLLQEPNTKFLGVTGMPLHFERRSQGESSFVSQPESESESNMSPSFHEQQIAVPIPRPAPLISISQTLSNLEAAHANPNLEHLDSDEYTYYHETPDDPIEYSNPDLLYLSQSITSERSAVSDVSELEEQPAIDNHEDEEPKVEVPREEVEPKVVYTDHDDDKASSDNDSVYESYPPSEADEEEVPSFISDVPAESPIKLTQSPTPITPLAELSPSRPIAEDHTMPEQTLESSHISSSNPPLELSHYDTDPQKIPRETAEMLQAQSMHSIRPSTSPSPLYRSGINPPARSLSEESIGSDSGLAESMIFSHEEAGSLYMSALGGSQPFTTSLAALAEEDDVTQTDSSPRNTRADAIPHIPQKSNVMLQKYLLRIDFVDIFIPGIASSPDEPVETPEAGTMSYSEYMTESSHPAMPGAFSVYAASRTRKKKPGDLSGSIEPSRARPKPNVSFQTSDVKSSKQSQRIPQTPPQPPPSSKSPVNRAEMEIGNVEVSVDFAVGKKLIVVTGTVLELVQIGNNTASPKSSVSKLSKEEPAQSDPTLVVSLVSLNITLVDKLPAITLSGEPDSKVEPHSSSSPTPDKNNDTVEILKISTSRLTFKKYSSLDAKSGYSKSVTEIVLRGCFVKVGQHDVIKFIRNQEPESKRSEKEAYKDSVLIFRITEDDERRYIQIKTVPMNFYFPIRGLEAMLPYFGGLESMLNLAASSNLSLKESTMTSHSSDSRLTEVPVAQKQTSLSVDVGGIIFELFISDFVGGIGISTSPIKVISNPANGLSVRIPQLALFGPDVASDSMGADSTLIVVSNINISFADSPSEDDLERLLTMITPSIDRYDGDDLLMIDVLLRQRRKGSVVRIDVGNVNGKMKDLNNISRFSMMAEELAKMATVAKYIPQDERPGMLTLIAVQAVTCDVFAGDELDTFSAKLGGLDICHVAAPTLLAFCLRQLSLIREFGSSEEEWVGESLPRSLTTSGEKDKNRPMLKVRMIGDEPEPEIKIKIWNARFEYHVDPVRALLSLTEKDTPDVLATNMVDSIANLAEKEITRHMKDSPQGSPNAQPLRLNIGLSGLCVALNPLDSPARALFLVQDGSFVCELSSQQPFSATLILNKANLVEIDDRHNLTSPQKLHLEPRKQKGELKEDLVWYTTQGYVSILTATSARASLKLEEGATDGEKMMAVEVEDVFIVVESCADSTQTLIGILNGMKPPLPESEEIKYLTQIMPVDVFANLDENAFVPMDNAFIGGQPRDLRSLEEIPEDLLEDEVPFNSQLIESYYPSSALPSSGGGGAAVPSQPPLTSFHEQVRVIAEEPLTFDDGYFQTPTKESKEKEEEIVPRRAALKVSVRNTQFIWNLHDGYDWHKTRHTISKAIQDVEERASRRRRHQETIGGIDDFEDEEEETYDVLFNSIYITLPAHRDPKDLSRDIQNQIRGDYDVQSETGSYAATTTTMDTQIPGGRHTSSRRRDQKFRRSQRNAMQFELKGVDVDFTIFAPDRQEVQSSVDLRIYDIQVTENVKTSTWRKFLTYMREAGVRERGLPMAHIHLDTLRPIPELAATELSIKVKLLPLRLYVDQDALEFLTRFFEFKDPDTVKPGAKVEEPFIQRCEIDTVRVKLDFKPKRVDYAGLRSGRTTEFMNFFILEEADMELRHVALNGVSGFERLGKDLNNIWMPDIKSNQLGGVLAGVAPVRSIVNIGIGVRDLVKVPIIEYRKDGRLVRSIKKGTQHFVKTSGSEVARLGAKLAIGTQTLLEKTEEFLVGEPSQQQRYHSGDSGDEEGESSNPAVFSPYADQPLGVYRGLVQAKHGLTRNLNEAKEAILRVPSEAAQGGSAKSAAAAVFRAAPTAVIRPMIGVTEAVHKTLHGIDNTIDKEKREKLRDKYKKR